MMQIKVSKLVYVIAILLFCSCSNEKAPTPLYDVISISDGDTFTLLTENTKQKKIRLYGIDSPEKGQPFGANAKQKLSELIFRKKVKIEIMDTDRYERAVAIVYNELDECINELMLQSGMAWHYKQYDNRPDWAKLEERARAQKLGLWSDARAIPPWEWRKGRRTAVPVGP